MVVFHAVAASVGESMRFLFFSMLIVEDGRRGFPSSPHTKDQRRSLPKYTRGAPLVSLPHMLRPSLRNCPSPLALRRGTPSSLWRLFLLHVEHGTQDNRRIARRKTKDRSAIGSLEKTADAGIQYKKTPLQNAGVTQGGTALRNSLTTTAGDVALATGV